MMGNSMTSLGDLYTPISQILMKLWDCIVLNYSFSRKKKVMQKKLFLTTIYGIPIFGVFFIPKYGNGSQILNNDRTEKIKYDLNSSQ